MDSPIDIRRAPSTPGLNGVDDRRGPARGSHHGTEPPWLPGPDSGGRRAAGATTPGVDLTREPCPSSRRDLEPSAGHPDDDSAQVRATAFLLMLMLMLIDAGAQSSQPFGLEPFSLARAQCPRGSRMVSGLPAVQAILIVQAEGWFEDWLWPVHIARAWLACGREGILLARAVRVVWEEDAAEAARIVQELDDAADAEFVPVIFAGYHQDSDGHFVADDSSAFWSDSD